MSEIRGTGFAVVRGHTRSDASEIPRWVTVRVITICLFAILAEGYDVGTYGAVLPALVDEQAWWLTPTQFDVRGSYALIGMLVGAVLVGALSDVIGRQKTLIACVGFFSITMAWVSFSRTPAEFGWCRFIGGLGLGGVIPTASALTIEYSPVRSRSFNYALMYSGYALGGGSIALLSLWLLQEAGWRMLFRIGAFPLLAIPVMAWDVPKSVIFLLSWGRTQEAGCARRVELTDDNGILASAFAPTVRKPVMTLLSGRLVFGLGDAVVTNDPITGQDANNATKACKVYLDAILAYVKQSYIREWIGQTFEQFWNYAQLVVQWTNSLLTPPPHVLNLLGAAVGLPSLASVIADGFNHPPSYFPWWVDAQEYERFLSRHEAISAMA
ncbi:MFS transporter [Burkholderia catarinensis]|uniref:MFS transporter n=1 Tax=Burkholderia catarinensis TaxID=1108140 RepID=UPI000AEB6752|nr:MFS transporter [Burkholderia catarinensis]KAG8148484.1 hypothetical protein BFF94_037720 [Burkholderia catarinensis]